MTSTKRTRNDENISFSFVDLSISAPKRVRQTGHSVSLIEIQNLCEPPNTPAMPLYSQKLLVGRQARRTSEAKFRVEQVLGSVTATGYNSLFAFVDVAEHP